MLTESGRKLPLRPVARLSGLLHKNRQILLCPIISQPQSVVHKPASDVLSGCRHHGVVDQTFGVFDREHERDGVVNSVLGDESGLKDILITSEAVAFLQGVNGIRGVGRCQLRDFQRSWTRTFSFFFNGYYSNHVIDGIRHGKQQAGSPGSVLREWLPAVCRIAAPTRLLRVGQPSWLTTGRPQIAPPKPPSEKDRSEEATASRTIVCLGFISDAHGRGMMARSSLRDCSNRANRVFHSPARLGQNVKKSLIRFAESKSFSQKGTFLTASNDLQNR